MNIALIGCGGVGMKRARALPSGAHLTVVCDVAAERAAAVNLALGGGASIEPDWRRVVNLPGIDAAIVATPNNQLAPITLAAVQAGKHVLAEKPGACRADELRPILAESEARGAVVRVGFNHRYHPAILKAKAMCEAGIIGPLTHLRARYGHGGRPGYEREWRADPAVSGGGELLDQGSHLIDLSRWLLGGSFASIQGCLSTAFWDMPVEDNAFLLLQTHAGQIAQLHASWSEWKNIFSFEIFGRDGKLEINGLGGSYGIERLTHYEMTEAMGPPDSVTWEWPGPDLSWQRELTDFLREAKGGRRTSSDLANAISVLELIESVYARTPPVVPDPALAGRRR
jgi:predicted dehydrogenase